jgi:glycerol-3-phosphate acyltransferase PlsY
MLLILAGLLFSYLLGSIPTAYLFGRLIRGIDIRRYGSGNVGATNAFRVLGPYTGITVLILDALKGVVCVVFISDFLISRGITIDGLLLRIILGITVVLGHSLTVFLRFKGGKGMATTLGVLIGLAVKLPALRIILTAEILIWFIVFLLSKIVSLASIVSAVFFPVLFIILRQPLPLIIMSLLLSIFVIFRHKSNIYRLLRNEEPRLKSASKK